MHYVCVHHTLATSERGTTSLQWTTVVESYAIPIIVGAGTNLEGLYLESCQLLLACGASQNLDLADSQYGRTATHWAVYYNRYDILVQLILAGNDIKKFQS